MTSGHTAFRASFRGQIDDPHRGMGDRLARSSVRKLSQPPNLVRTVGRHAIAIWPSRLIPVIPLLYLRLHTISIHDEKPDLDRHACCAGGPSPIMALREEVRTLSPEARIVKFEIQQEDLQKALDVIANVVPSKTTLPILSCVLLEADEGEPDALGHEPGHLDHDDDDEGHGQGSGPRRHSRREVRAVRAQPAARRGDDRAEGRADHADQRQVAPDREHDERGRLPGVSRSRRRSRG